ncbi:hypothetical protein HY469_00870, partial [Candidatus Roizmanbacteria bacterium]|nr:hypothetical protein [Candidatus Roizmanbacteria bacterium]
YVVLIIVAAIIGVIVWFTNPQLFTSFTDYVSTTKDTLTSSDSAAMKPVSLTRDIARKADLSVMQAALLQYRIEKGVYPDSLSQLYPDFIGEIPTDPQTNEPYVYHSIENGESYQVCINWETSGNGEACISPN